MKFQRFSSNFQDLVLREALDDYYTWTSFVMRTWYKFESHYPFLDFIRIWMANCTKFYKILNWQKLLYTVTLFECRKTSNEKNFPLHGMLGEIEIYKNCDHRSLLFIIEKNFFFDFF